MGEGKNSVMLAEKKKPRTLDINSIATYTGLTGFLQSPTKLRLRGSAGPVGACNLQPPDKVLV